MERALAVANYFIKKGIEDKKPVSQDWHGLLFLKKSIFSKIT